MPLHVAFLWHMHQPYYVDPIRGEALMPWVRMHATKGYLDMVWLADQFPEVKCTFNLTPVLVKQIRQLAAGEVRDFWHELATTPADALTTPQKCSLLEHFFKANWDNMIKPFPRYWSLLQKRGLNVGRVNLSRLAGNFSTQDYRDLQVWFNLAWFGYAGEVLYPEIAELKSKGGNFTEDDKKTLFDQQTDVLRGVLNFYKALSDRGQIELSTTPFYHPIMPLVHNTEFARRCMPGREMPPPFSRPEDVRAQLATARDHHAQVFGAAPHGIWPSEGSVCPELIPILQDVGLQWFATDEEVLWRSLAVASPNRVHDRADLFQGYRAQFGDATASIAFRDRTLSDFVGFTASRNDPNRAADFMIGHLQQVARNARGSDPLCAVILDGENAWEHFPDGGEMFLRQFYHRLSTAGDLKTTTFHEYFTAHPPVATINTLHTGSWINADFDIWIGDPEENRGWELLGQTRNFIQAKMDRKEITPEQYQKALQEIYAAEGSDWFWWYGGDFVTDNDLIFDELFRTHLQNVYHIIGTPVPDVLKTQICRSEAVHETAKPTDLITPQIDGRVTSFYEWVGAGLYQAGRAMTAMYRSERIVDRIHFGSDLANLYLRVDFRKDVKLADEVVLRINFIRPSQYAVSISPLSGSVLPKAKLWDTNPQSGISELGEVGRISYQEVLELAVAFQALNLSKREHVAFFVQILDRSVEIERHPEMGTMSFVVPDDQFEVENWRA